MRRPPAGTCLLISIAVIAAACGGVSGTRSLADYAEGDWTCRLGLVDPNEGDVPIPIEATVTTTADTEGRVEITFPWTAELAVPDGENNLVLAGDWRLDDGELVVRWDGDWGQAEALPISLDVDRLRIRSGRAEEAPEWVTVDVDRRDRSVTFAFTAPDAADSDQLSCEKA
jgi:hypothetical protein